MASEHFLYILVYCVVLVELKEYQPATVTELYLGTVLCSYQQYQVQGQRFYEIVWGGEHLVTDCRLGFTGESRPGLYDDYKICVDVIEYRVRTCSFSMTYYITGINHPRIKTSCGKRPGRFCVGQNDLLQISFENFIASDTSHVRLLVSTDKMNKNKPSRVDIVVACVVGGAILAVTFSIMLAIQHLRRDRRGKHQPIPAPQTCNPDPDRETVL